ncbi:ABC transporter ATP-binding protein [Alicyclobacillus sp. ALC3]|uniref:ABC transporter ATP-binding protein n=1 Tax=Alicyclobacillus sp. ALC3 TaxID=2796143 RepID=UPI002378FB4A|nr:ABC transporter ATP-binding protein [Alicyclobacillus sp. ALC3]WDL96046.1 ABC transporter ATP-binding protein [Alicyclobacillus sp. ALC3]
MNARRGPQTVTGSSAYGGPGGGQRGGFGGGPQALGRPVEKPRNFRRTLLRFLGYMAPQWPRLTVVIGAAIASTVFSIFSPRVLGGATTRIFAGVLSRLHGGSGGIDFAYIERTIAILLGLYLFSALFSYVQQYIMAGVAQRVVYQIRQQVDQKLSRMPLEFYDSHPHGEVQSRFVNDFDNISNTLQQSLTQFITSIVTFIGVIVMMLSISRILTVAVVLTLPLSLWVTGAVAKRSQKYFMGQQRTLGQLNAHVEEMYTGHPIIKAFGHERAAIATFESVNEELYQTAKRAQFISGIIMPMMNFIGNLGFVFVSVIGGILVARRSITIGDVQAFIQYARQFSQPITQLASIANIIQSTMASAERVFELLDEPEERPDMATPVVLTEARGAVSFECVVFGYHQDAPVIRDLSLDVKPGQTIAIVGPTGAGKTTLVNLLMRFYEVQDGRITIDGHDITTLPRENLRSLFGMVLQDAWLFNGTIRENIAYGRKDATETDVVTAAVAARADHFIRTLPDGYDTMLNEEASNLSQGQRQLLTIARAVLADPAILILDEATSNVDTRTEVQIQLAMSSLMKGRTSFVIAHRLSTIRNADIILVMDHGRLVEQGTHQSLLAAGGFYAKLYESQFASTGWQPEFDWPTVREGT